MTEPIRPLDLHRQSINPIVPVRRRHRSEDRDNAPDEREPEQRERREAPAEGDEPLGGGHIDVIA